MSYVYPVAHFNSDAHRVEIDEIEASTWGDRLYCLCGKAHYELVEKLYQRVNDLNAQRDSRLQSQVTPLTIGSLRLLSNEFLPIVEELNDLDMAIEESQSLYRIDWDDEDQDLLSLVVSVVAYAVHKVACAFWNLFYHMGDKEKSCQETIATCREKEPAVELGAIRGAQSEEYQALELFGAIDVAKEGSSISETRLKLRIPVPSKQTCRWVDLERTHENALVLSLGGINQEEGLLLMRVAVELMNSQDSSSKVWLRYSGDVDFTPYGFTKPTGKDKIPQGKGRGNEWVVFHKKSEFNRFHEALTQLEGSSGDYTTWKELIQHKPLLRLNAGVSLFNSEALPVISSK